MSQSLGVRASGRARSTRLLPLALVLAAVFRPLALPAASQSAPPLADLLGRLGTYVADYERKVSAVVVEEAYTQEVHPAVTSFNPGDLHRRTRSDLLVINAGDGVWIAFRDVFDVDGRAVHDHDNRLEALFLQPSAKALDEATRLADESARYNIGTVKRNINVPTMALEYARAANQPRSTFRMGGRDKMDDVPVREVDFVETSRPTIVRSGDQDLPMTGAFWIEPESGRVLRSRLEVRTKALHTRIEVSYGENVKVDLCVPTRMTESYATVGQSITAVATYSNPRKFKVDVSTIIKK